MELIIRAMQQNDWIEVATIYQDGINTETATFQTEVPSYEEWDKSHIKECRLVAEENNRVIGWVALSPSSSRCVYSGVAELSVYIKEECRGKQVGSKLMQAAITESEKEGFWSLLSVIIESNESSIALHSKAGFRMIGYREKIAKDANGVWLNTVMMERRSDTVGI
jgi:L-amino acid N-acyltransferase YncA